MTTFICPGCDATFHDEHYFVTHCHYACPEYEAWEAAGAVREGEFWRTFDTQGGAS